MNKKILLLVILVVFCLPFEYLTAAAPDKAVESAFQLAESKKTDNPVNNLGSPKAKVEIEDKEAPSTIPDWVKRTSYGIYFGTGQKPRIYLETVQPLYQSFEQVDTFFTHNRVSIQDERGTYSAGLGYRRLMFDENLLAGINSFFDYQDLHQHYRQGVGIEAITKYLEFRANSYFGLSSKRLIEETSTSKTFEKAATGGDVELGGPIPYLPWLKVFGSYYRYDFRKFKDMQGWKARGEIKPFKFITFNLETYDDNKGDQEYRMDTRFNLAFDNFTPKSILAAFKSEKEPYPDVDLKKRALDRVERNFIIQVEKWVETGGMSLEIGRK